MSVVKHQYGNLPAYGPENQRGVVLVGGLFFLMVMTLVGVAMMKNIALEEKIASNTREKLRSFEAAELTLKIAEAHLQKQLDILPFYATGNSTIPGMYLESAGTHPWQNHNNWVANQSLAITDDQNLPSGVAITQTDLNEMQLNSAPRYMMGLKGETNLDGMDSGISHKFYQFVVTANSESQLPHVKTTLQTQVVEAY